MLPEPPFEACHSTSAHMPLLHRCCHHCDAVMLGQVACRQGHVSTSLAAPAMCMPRVELSPSSLHRDPCANTTWLAPIAACPLWQNAVATQLGQPREDKAPAPSYLIHVPFTHSWPLLALPFCSPRMCARCSLTVCCVQVPIDRPVCPCAHL
jgi:hypothetical protein